MDAKFKIGDKVRKKIDRIVYPDEMQTGTITDVYKNIGAIYRYKVVSSGDFEWWDEDNMELDNIVTLDGCASNRGCSCSSRDLFNFGCRCGFLNKK